MSVSSTFRCNLCGEHSQKSAEKFGREIPSCSHCGSTVRLRGLVALVSQELFGTDLALPDFPVVKGFRGIGMSDPAALASRLGEKLDYTNTFYHQSPRFDVTHPPEEDFGRYDFIVSSEVMEHVPVPVESAFANLCRMLKPDGFLLLTVPYRLGGGTEEHYPELHEYALASPGGRTVLVNRKADGGVEVFENLCFHGGDGSTLEMRVFSEESLKQMLRSAGFSDVQVAAESNPQFGVEHAETWSLPIVARKGSRARSSPEIAQAFGEACRQADALRQELTAMRDEHQRFIEFHKTSHAEMERQLTERAEWVKKVEGDFEARTQWALSLDKEKQEVEVEFARVRGAEAQAWQRVAELEKELGEARVERLRLESRLWTRTGRRLGVVR